MPGDLVSGGYPLTYPMAKVVGRSPNLAQGNLNVRSNAEWFGVGTMTDGALAATGVGCAVAIPVEVGDVFSKITLLAGATAEATGTHAFGALYSGIAVPALLGQSADNTGAAAIAASAAFPFTLQAPITITQAIAPSGFIYASICVTAGTIPTAAVVATPAAIGYQWFANGPLFLAATHGSALLGTAPATIAAPAAKAVAPLVFLS